MRSIAERFPTCHPPRYVFHASPRFNRSRIAREGLRPHTAIPVHGKSPPLVYAMCISEGAPLCWTWYPLCLGECLVEVQPHAAPRYLTCELATPELVAEAYDFWRISTEGLSAPWFVDLIGEMDFRRDTPGIAYVCTPQHIPASLLTRFQLVRRPRLSTSSFFLSPAYHSPLK